jgi:hypothetical protein
MILISQCFFSKDIFFKGCQAPVLCLLKISAYSFVDSEFNELGKVMIENLTSNFNCANNYNYEFVVSFGDLQNRFLKSCSFYQKYGWNLHHA